MNLNLVFSSLRYRLDLYRPRIGEDKFRVASDVIFNFERWYRNENITIGELYDLVDMHDIDEGIFEYAECGEDDEPKDIYYLWQIVLSALIVILHIAFEREGGAIPQDIDFPADKIEEFLTLFIDPVNTSEDLFNFYQNCW